MKQVICGSIGKSVVSMAATLIMLAFPASFPDTPRTGWAQNIPEPVAACAYCGARITTGSEKHKRGCPYYREEKPAVKTGQKAEPPSQPADLYGNFLFYDVPITSVTGKPPLPAHTEDWGLQMKEIAEQSRLKREAQLQEFERNKLNLLQNPGRSGLTGASGLQLKNVYANGKAWDSPLGCGDGEAQGDPNIVNLQGKDGAIRQFLQNPYRNADPAAAAGSPMYGASNEYQQMALHSEQAKYAHMQPAQLDAIGRQYPDNKEIQQTIARLKATKKSMDVLGSLSEQISANEELMNSEQQKGNREAARTVATVTSLTTKVPGGWDEVLYGEKTLAQWVGVDLASDRAGDRFQDFAVGKADDYYRNRGWTIPDPKKSLKGIGSVVEGVTAAGDLVSLAKSANAAGEHYVAAGELRAQTEASGGTVHAVSSWSNMRNKALEQSALLERLVQEAEARKNQSPTNDYRSEPAIPWHLETKKLD